MAHITIEHSANLPCDVDQVVDALHTAALATGTAALDALRTRALAYAHYAVGDRHPENAFIAVTARLGPGRTQSQKSGLLDTLMAALEAVLGEQRQRFMLSVELQEIEASQRINSNHLRPIIDGRHDGENH